MNDLVAPAYGLLHQAHLALLRQSKFAEPVAESHCTVTQDNDDAYR